MDLEQGGSGVQPEGQGPESTETQEQNLDGFYDLSSVPEEQREFVEPILKDVQSNVNKKIEQLNGRYSPYQPFVDLNIHENPELMEDLATLAQIAGDEDALREWWTDLGKEYDWVDDEANTDDLEFDEGDDSEVTQADIQQFQEAIANAIDQRVSPLYEAQAEREQEQAVQDADKQIGQQLAELKEKHGEFNEAAVCKLALGYDGEDAIQKGFEEYQSIIQNAQNGVFETANNAPATPEGPGSADTSQPKITSFADAKAAARERMKQSSQV